MNYYPNNFMYQPYQSQYQTQYPQPNYQQVQPQQAIQPQFQQSTPTLNGKIVDGKEIVTVTEIPIGSYGVFPKADMSAVYIKTWKNDGTTEIVEYSRVEPTSLGGQTPTPNFEEVLTDIYDQISKLGKKIDGIKPTKQTSRRKELDDEDDE